MDDAADARTTPRVQPDAFQRLRTERNAWKALAAEQRRVLGEIADLCGPGGDDTPFGRVESMLSALTARAEEAERERDANAADACVRAENVGPCRLRCCGGEGGDEIPCAMCGHGHAESSGSATCNYRWARDLLERAERAEDAAANWKATAERRGQDFLADLTPLVEAKVARDLGAWQSIVDIAKRVPVHRDDDYGDRLGANMQAVVELEIALARMERPALPAAPCETCGGSGEVEAFSEAAAVRGDPNCKPCPSCAAPAAPEGRTPPAVGGAP